MIQEGLTALLQELESHCQSTAIATFLNSDGQVFVVDLNRKGDQIVYGYQLGVKELFMSKIVGGSDPRASIVLRSFTPEIDEISNLPYKELRGYIVRRDDDGLRFEKLSPKDMFVCYNTDAQTGEPRPLEHAIRYC